jgi:hypothetical protein
VQFFLLGEEKKMRGVGEDGLLFKRKHALQGWNAAHACRLGGSAFLPTENRRVGIPADRK